jgi:hypothetical protein
MNIISPYPINIKTIEDTQKNLKDYNIIASQKIKQNSPKVYLTDSIPNKCRFCGKSYPEVKFENNAHAIPEFMGNKKIFSKYECDACNKSYFSLFENEMANFMLPHSSLSGIKGKNKIPKYHQKGNPIIQHDLNKIVISDVPDSMITAADQNYIDIPIKIPTYVPEHIYRCLVKIGLSIIPKQYMPVYKETINWLMNMESNSNITPFMLFSMYPYQIQMNEIVCLILERKDECMKDIPHSIFFLSYNNYAFQTLIPNSLKEKFNVQIKAIPFKMPTLIDLNKEYENMRTDMVIDLSSKEHTTTESFNLHISGDRHIVD